MVLHEDPEDIENSYVWGKIKVVLYGWVEKHKEGTIRDEDETSCVRKSKQGPACEGLEDYARLWTLEKR